MTTAGWTRHTPTMSISPSAGPTTAFSPTLPVTTMSAATAKLAESATECHYRTQPEGTFTDFYRPCQVLFLREEPRNETIDSTSTGTPSYQCGPSDQYEVLHAMSTTLWAWPDRCVGSEQRCYKLSETTSMPSNAIGPSSNHRADRIQQQHQQQRQFSHHLTGLPENTINEFRFDLPLGTTTVLVNCLLDAQIAKDYLIETTDDWNVSLENWNRTVYNWNSPQSMFSTGAVIMTLVWMYCCFRSILRYVVFAQTQRHVFAYRGARRMFGGMASQTNAHQQQNMEQNTGYGTISHV